MTRLTSVALFVLLATSGGSLATACGDPQALPPPEGPAPVYETPRGYQPKTNIDTLEQGSDPEPAPEPAAPEPPAPEPPAPASTAPDGPPPAPTASGSTTAPAAAASTPGATAPSAPKPATSPEL
jgi:Wiskott-Aldrich syndrome protein